MTDMASFYENIDEMVSLCHQKIETLIQLKKAFLLADLLGVPPKDMKQPLTMRVWDTGYISAVDPTPWRKKVLSLRLGDNPWEDFALIDVNRYLWPEDMQKAWERHQKRKEQVKP